MFTILIVLLQQFADTGGVLCTQVAVDIGFVLDSSGSVGHFYQNEKDFIKDIGGAFYARSPLNRAGVVTFSSHAVLSINLGQYRNAVDFKNAVDRIPHIASGTRIDLGLEVARDSLFTYEEVGRDNVQKLLVLLTDGRTGGEPVPIGDAMRREGTMIMVIGIGSNIDVTMLRRIGGESNYYGADSFNHLVSQNFIDDITQATCETIYLPAPDGMFYKLYNESKSFDDSSTYCENEGSHLPIADSESTHNHMKQTYGSLSIWLGAKYDEQLGKWLWNDGQPAEGAHWGQQGPTTTNDVCLSLRGGKWYHTSCNSDHVFLCQKGVTKPEPPTVSYDVVGGRLSFKCQFKRKQLTIPATYEVTWYNTSTFGGQSAVIHEETLQNGNVSYLPEQGGKELYSLGMNIYCKVRTWYTNEANTKSESAVSNKHFANYIEGQIPELESIRCGTVCDVRRSDCSKVPVRSNRLVPGGIVCGISWRNSFSVKDAELKSFAEVICGLPGRHDVPMDRYRTKNNGIPIQRYNISISNNGANFSNDVLPFIVYDSKCMVCSNSTTACEERKRSCDLKENTCLIKGYCYESGDADPDNAHCRVCDPTRITSMFVIRRDSPAECRASEYSASTNKTNRKSFSANLTMSIPFTEDLNNKSSVQFSALTEEVEPVIFQVCNIITDDNVFEVRILGFSKGSVVVDFLLIMRDNHKSDNITSTSLTIDLNHAIANGRFETINVEPNSTKVTVTDLNKCLVADLHDCHKQLATCTVTAADPHGYTCVCKTGYHGDGVECDEDDEADDDLALKIALPIVFILLFIVFVVLVVYRIKTRRPREERDRNTTYDNKMYNASE